MLAGVPLNHLGGGGEGASGAPLTRFSSHQIMRIFLSDSRLDAHTFIRFQSRKMVFSTSYRHVPIAIFLSDSRLDAHTFIRFQSRKMSFLRHTGTSP